ncbi:hypothetical protein D3C59_30105 [Streptomyces sp. SHP22-7]|nr:hypothetical protein D3C59_30105 [Streptomyces sp. SHP22-7]
MVGLMTRAKAVIIDAWSYLNYKPLYSETRGVPYRRAFPEAAATWVPPEDERRLAAYKLLAAYDQNQAAELAELRDGPEARDRREFGDPSMFVDAILAHVLGREQQITVPGAGDQAADDAPDAEAAMADRVQTLLRDWAEDELLPMRVQQTERKAVSLGDGVYRLAWDPAKQRATVRSVDPGFYFPIIGEDDDGGEFPQRVHFCWELPEDKRRDLKARIRRITYELAPIGPATAAGVSEDGRAIRAPLTTDDGDGNLVPVLGPGDLPDPETGSISRLYPWNDQPTTLTCYLTDATWNLDDLKGDYDVDSLPLDKASYATRSDGEVLDHLDLLIDFLPVVHVPNTVPAAEEHWGSRRWRRSCRCSTSWRAPTRTPPAPPLPPAFPWSPCPGCPTSARSWRSPLGPCGSSARAASSPPSTPRRRSGNSVSTSTTCPIGPRPSPGSPPSPSAPSTRPRPPPDTPSTSPSGPSTPSSAACGSPATTSTPCS